MNAYKLMLFANVVDGDGSLDHEEIVIYSLDEAPFVPRVGDFIRIRDPEVYRFFNDKHRNGGQDIAGWVTDVVTTFYGGTNNGTTIEVYINPRHSDSALKALQADRRKP